ncbi:MAG TPA: PhzF family phenazine biosynthesis isomerase, partial [Gaiellaceae bacterium]|nr:PhzF family phenazine biosynthesis isomerase [Gaiellaceae bacterium]
MRRFRYVVADVFTDVALAGNQLAVFTDARDLTTEDMQTLALELRLSETVFVLPPDDDATARIRIFTPSNELPFAGHPVLGTAIFLALRTASDQVTLATGAGLVPITIDQPGTGRMTQPVPDWSAFP